ncbi:unnamed protein product [Urochloa decumbens]|uniref:GRF-type domain-containing protein n=1 Tax=Urochloa decumbens TaxID=240449 RepID=A0ABC8Y6D7_9POAL
MRLRGGGGLARSGSAITSTEPAGMSIPDKSVVYHAEGMFYKVFDGVLVNRSCPFQAKEMVDPAAMQSLQHMRRWIMQAFQISDATHGITLRHIVLVKITDSARPYRMLVDIVGDDAWTAFLSVRSRNAGSFVLYVQWHAKAPAPVAGGMATPEVAADKWPSCKHGKPCTIETDRGYDNPGRRFYRCRLFTDPVRDCGFMQWLDDKFPEKATNHINRLQSRVCCLEQQVENLQEELDELRRRNMTSSHCAPPSDSQESETRPCQIRRLATVNN